MNKIRISLDIAMTILSIILMGGAYLFPADIIHEILGAALFVLWTVHISLNRRWYSALFRGKYNSRRILQTVINCSILLCVIFLMISGIILSSHLFAFLKIESGLGFARIAHLLASHWYYLFMSLHIGLHVGMIANKIKQKREAENNSTGRQTEVQPENESSQQDNSAAKHNKAGKIVFRIFVALACAYGFYAFIIRGIWKYLILRQQFFFFDLERGYLLFALDYISIIVLFAAISHLLATCRKKYR